MQNKKYPGKKQTNKHSSFAFLKIVFDKYVFHMNLSWEALLQMRLQIHWCEQTETVMVLASLFSKAARDLWH